MYEDKARDYFKEVVAHTRTLTDLPITSPEETKFNEDNKCADFKTKEGTLRVRGNRKGVFTKEREPKAAAFLLKKSWENDIKK